MERYGTVIVGGSQAGLSVGYHLQRRNMPFVILDRYARVGDAWRARWDSLRLFTPAKFNGLDGMRFPMPANHKPTKDEMADYLEAYAARFELPVRGGVTVSRISRAGQGFVLETDAGPLEAENVVIATGSAQAPWMPAYAQELDPRITQLHSFDYRNPSQVRDGGVLVVGCGNSGAEIAIELSRTNPTWIAGKETGHIPFDIDSFKARLLVYGVRFVGDHVLSRGTPIGRKVGPKLIGRGTPLVRTKPKQIVAAGVERVPRVAGVRDGMPLLEDGRVLDVNTVIWCTGFRLDYSWIDLPAFNEDGMPRHVRGVVPSEPGLYFMGLPFQFSITSETVPGVGRDARYVVEHMAASQDRGARATSAVE